MQRTPPIVEMKKSDVKEVPQYVRVLVRALIRDRADLVRGLTQRPGPIGHIRDAGGNNMLHLCAKLASPSVLDALTSRRQHPIDVNSVNKQGRTALHLAVDGRTSRHHKVASQLLKAGADLFLADNAGLTALEGLGRNSTTPPELVKVAYRYVVERIRKTSPVTYPIIAEKLMEAKWPLRFSLWVKNFVLTKMILDTAEGAQSINAVTGPLDMTAIQYAVQSAVPAQVIELLLDRGADPNVCWSSHSSSTPLHWVAYRARKSLRPEMARALLRGGANVEALVENDRTPLHLAIKVGFWEVVDILLEEGANIHALDARQNSCLHFAAFQDNLEMIQKLLSLGFSLDAKNQEGSTPLHCAAQHFRPKTIEFLLAQGANVWLEDNWNMTPLMRTIFMIPRIDPNGPRTEENALETIDCFLRLGAINKCRCVFSLAPIKLACRLDLEDVIIMMIRYMMMQIGAEGLDAVAAILSMTEPNEKMYKGYQECEQELVRMEGCVVCGKLTYLEAVLCPNWKMKKYVKHQDLPGAVDAMDDDVLKLVFPIFGMPMKKRLLAELAKYDNYKKAAQVLSDTLTLNDPQHILVEGVLKYFDQSELDFLARF